MELQQDAQRLSVPIRGGLGRQVELGHDVAPTQKLASQLRIGLDLDGEIHQFQRPFVASTQLCHAIDSKVLQSALQLHADLEDLLAEIELRPPLGRQRRILRHGCGLPVPSRRKTTSRIRARIAGSSTPMPGLLPGRMLISESYSTQSSWSWPG